MILFVNFALDYLTGDLNSHASDLTLDLVDSFTSLLCNVFLCLFFHGSYLTGSFLEHLFTLDSRCFLSGLDNVICLVPGFLHILFVFGFHSLSFFLRLHCILDLRIGFGPALVQHLVDRLKKKTLNEIHLNKKVANRRYKIPRHNSY